MMNSRIELVSAEEVRVRRSSPCGNYDPITTLVILSGGRLNLVQDGRWDAEGRAALRDCLNCFDTHGTFAPLADTDGHPFIGKQMRRKVFLGSPETENEPCEIIAHVNGEWWSLPGVCAHGAMRAEHFLPLTPAPPKRVRPYRNAVEAAVLVGQFVRFEDSEKSQRVRAVREDGVEFSPGSQWDTFDALAKYYTLAETKEPCGIEEAT